MRSNKNTKIKRKRNKRTVSQNTHNLCNQRIQNVI